PRLTAARLALARSQLERSLGALLATDPPDRRAPEALMAAYATLPFPAVGDHVWKRVRQAIPTTSGKRAARFGPLRLVMAVTAVSLALVAGWALARSDARPGPAAAGPPVVPAQIGGVPTSGSAVPESTDTPGPRGATASPSRSPSASPSPSRKPTPTSVSATSKAPGPFSVSASSSEKNCPLLGGTEFTATATVSGTPASSVVVRLAGRGYRLVAADVDGAQARHTAGRLGGTAVEVDVSDHGRNVAMVARAVEAYGRLDLVVLNAGVNSGQSAGDPLDVARYRRTNGVNVDGVVFGIDAALPVLSARGGAIVVISSLACLAPQHANPVYALGKSAVVGYVR